MAKRHFFKGTRVHLIEEAQDLFPGKKAGVCVNQRPDKAGCVRVQWDAPEGGLAVVHTDFLEIIE